VANVSYLRTPAGSRTRTYRTGGLGAAPGRRRAPWLIGGGLLLVLCLIAAAAIVVATSKATITGAPGELAKIDMPLGGGTVDHVVATTGVQNKEKYVKVHLRGDPTIVPAQKIAAGEKITITAKVHRPGWISWLAGKTETLTRTVTAPASTVRNRYITLTRSGRLEVHFSSPVRSISYGPSAARVTKHSLGGAQRTVTLPHNGSAGTMYVSATVQRWETAKASSVSWFPAGTKATAVAQPSSGATIKSNTPITLAFSKPVSQVLGSHMPAVTPAGAGSWHTISSHAIRFEPSGYGYGLDQTVNVALPSGVRLAGAAHSGSSTSGVWHVPAGSTARLQEVLAQLGYLPLTVHYAGAAPADTVAAQEIAAEDPPQASVSWTYADTPSGLKQEWDGLANASELTKGAMMKFQSDHDLAVTGYEDSETWNALFQAVAKNERNTFGYTFVSVSEGSPESLFVWHSGKTVLSGIPVNTGVPGATTQTGTFAVFEHLPVTTMIGTNVDGSHYDDPGIKWVSYFNGGDALHYYPRGGYGYPQSNGCVEMDLPDAASVYPYTPVGTIVQVNS
jgi:peptidoglycan hydrolase-like protein with peptidoglycan-binding domain